MSGWLPLGDSAHTVFISCQMLVLIILSFPVVPPTRQQRPPSLSPLTPCLNAAGSDSLFPLLTHSTIFSLSHGSTISFFSAIFSHLVAAPSSSTPSSLCWLVHLGKVKSIEMLALCQFRLRCFIKWMQKLYSHPCSYKIWEDLLTW